MQDVLRRWFIGAVVFVAASVAWTPDVTAQAWKEPVRGSWLRDGDSLVVCFALPRGESVVETARAS